MLFKRFRTYAAAAALALLASLAPSAAAQEPAAPAPQQTPQPQTPPQQPQQTPQQTPPQQATPAAPAAPAQPAPQSDAPAQATPQEAPSAAGEAVAARPAPEPLYREYRGVTLGMKAEEVRAKLGKPQEKGDDMDFFVLSGRERARVYYREGKATAVIATYIGGDAGAPAPAAVLGSEIEAKADGSMYQMSNYPQAGYWVAYSRTAGDAPMVIITMQKRP
ncbi:MAG TPA: hypothetical protein VF668_02285 [Pyrinomonadaceae bacterium]|jgi:hypothetical protein